VLQPPDPKGQGRSQLDAEAAPYQIVKRLHAAEDGEFQYEIRSAVEESELTRYG
jgi:hypothetical protein